MPESKNKLLDTLTRMIELTQQGRLRWDFHPEIPTHRIVNPISAVFYATYNQKVLRLYQMVVGVDPRAVYNVEIPEDDKRIVLEFIDWNGDTLWSFPQVAALNDLFAAAQYQVAGVSEFMDSLMDEPNSTKSE